MTAQRTYEDILGAYVGGLRTLFVAPGMDAAGLDEPDQLPARAEQLADLAQQFGAVTVSLLQAPDRAQQLEAEARLLSHAAASAQAACKLFETAMLGSADAIGEGPGTPGLSLHELATMVEAPPAAPESPASPPVSADPNIAKASLSDEANRTLQTITVRTCKVVDDAFRDLLLLDAATLYQGVELVSKDAAELLQQAAATLGSLAERLVTSAIRLLLEAFNAILALLGSNTEQGRRQVSKWVDQLKAQGQGQQGLEMVTRLVVHIYEPDSVKEDVATWLQATQAPPDQIAQTAVTVQGLSKHYDDTADRVEQLLKVIVFLKALPLANTPQGAIVVASAMLGLVGYTVYTGYTHVDSGRVVFGNRFGFDIPERIAGVRQTVQTALAIVEEPSPPPA
jgi:hypothetical protein